MSPRRWPRRPAPPALGAGVAALALLAPLVSRTLMTGDGPELAGTLAEPGIAHPPGYAAYTLLGHAWGRALRALCGPAHMPWSLSGAWFSVAWMVLAAVAWLALWRRLVPPEGRPSAAAWVAMACAGLGWLAHPMALVRGATVEVYAMHLGLIGLTWWLTATVLAELAPAAGAARPAPWRCGALGLLGALGCLHHATFVLAAPPVLLVLGHGVGRAWARLSRGTCAACAAAAGLGLLLGLATLAYLPWRSAQEPVFNWGTPGLGWDYFWRHITARQYGFLLDQAGQGGAVWRNLAPLDRALLGLVAGVLVASVWRVWRSRTGAAAGGPLRLLPGALALHAALQLAFNFSYGIVDIGEYFLPVWWLGALLAAVGLARAAGRLAARPRLLRGGVCALAVLAVAWTSFGLKSASVRLATAQRRIARLTRLFTALPPEPAVVVISNDLHGLLLYLQVAEGLQPQFTVHSPHALSRMPRFVRAARDFGIVPVLFYDERTDTPGRFFNTAVFAPVIKRNLLARATVRLIDFDPATQGAVPVMHPPQPADPALALARGGVAMAPGDLLPLRKTLALHQQATGQPLEVDPALYGR